MLSYQPDLHAGKDADISIAANLCAWDDRRVNIAQCKNAITGRADIATQAAQHGSAITISIGRGCCAVPNAGSGMLISSWHRRAAVKTERDFLAITVPRPCQSIAVIAADLCRRACPSTAAKGKRSARSLTASLLPLSAMSVGVA
jgi:hypothetical protein